MLLLIACFLLSYIYLSQSCIIPQSDGSCAFCNYSTYSDIQNRDASKRPTQCLKKNIQTVYTSEVYISSIPCKNRQCSGTLNDPYDNFASALITEYLKAEQYLIATLTFNLQVGNYYVTPSDIAAQPQLQLFRRELWSVIIKPQDSIIQSQSDSLSDENKPKIYLRTDLLFLFVSGKLTIFGIAFDGSDMILGYQTQFLSQINDHTNLCAQSQPIGCVIAGANSSGVNAKGYKSFGFITTEIILELDSSADPQVQNFISNHYQSYPVLPNVAFIQVKFLNFYTGVQQNDILMNGFKPLILPNLGGVFLSLFFVQIQNSFFTDGIFANYFNDVSYLEDQKYSLILSNSSNQVNFIANKLTISNYNQWQIGTQSDNSDPQVFNTLFNFNNGQVQALFEDTIITNCQIQLRQNQLFNNLIRIISSTAKVLLNIVNFEFSSNINFLILLADTGTQFQISGQNLIYNTTINTPDSKLLGENSFLFSNIDADGFKIQHTKFQLLNGYIYFVSGIGSSFINCVFDTINIPSNGMIFYLSAPQSATVYINQSDFLQIHGKDITSSLSFNMLTTNSLTLNQTKIHDSSNIVIFDNRNINYNFFIYDSEFYKITGFIICQTNRLQIGLIYNTQFRQITSTYPLLQQLGNDGARPQFMASNCTFDQMQIPSILATATVNSIFTFQNITITNYIGSQSIITICCFAFMNSYNSTFINVSSPQIYIGINSEIIIGNQQFLNDNRVGSFVQVTQKSDLKMEESYFYSQDLKILNALDCKTINLNDISIEGKRLGQVLIIDTASSTQLQNVSFEDLSEKNKLIMIESQYLIKIFNSDELIVKNITINGLNRQGILINENSETFNMLDTIFQDIDCGQADCFSFSNSPATLLIQNLSLTNIVIQDNYNLITVQFCESIIFGLSYLNNISCGLDSSLFKIFQSAAVINDTILFSIVQNKLVDINSQGSLLIFQDTTTLIISNLTINNSYVDSSKMIPLGSISTLLVNTIYLIGLEIIQAQNYYEPLMSFQEFSQMQITNLTTIRCFTTLSIIWISTSLKNLLIILDGLTCDTNNASQSACLELNTASNFQITKLRALNTQGGLIYIQSSNQAIINMSDISVVNASNINTHQRMFTFIGSNIVINQLSTYYLQDENIFFDISLSKVQIHSSNLLELLPLKSNIVIFNLVSSSLWIKYTTFKNTFNADTQLIESEQSSLIFQYILVEGLNGKIFQSRYDVITLDKSTFFNNRKGIYFQGIDTNITVNEAQFQFYDCEIFFFLQNGNPQNQDISFKNSNITILRNGNIGSLINFRMVEIINTSIQSLGTTLGLIIKQANVINFKRSNFSGLRNLDGGCVKIISDGQINILSASFNKCSAKGFGGAIYLEGSVQGLILNSSFISNKALIGGGLVYNSPASNKKLILKLCQFIGNYAKNYGGSLMILDQAPQIEEVFYSGNMGASQVDKGECALKVESLGEQNITQMIRLSRTAITQFVQQQLQIGHKEITIASGQIYQLVIVLLDEEGQLTNIDQVSTINLQAPSGVGKDTLIDNGFSKSIDGVFYFPKLQFNHMPGAKFKVKLQINYAYGNLTDSKNPKSLTKEQTWLIQSRFCKRGEILSQDNTCTICGQNTYSLPDPQDKRLISQSCQYCPNTAYCIQEAIFPKKGFWILEQSSNIVLECINRYYCLGMEDLYFKRVNSTGVELEYYVNQTQKMYSSQCILGQSGALCQECEAGYFKFTNTSQCIPCQGNKALTFFVILLMIGLLMTYSIYQSQNYMAKNQEGQERAILIKIFLNYFQTTSLLGAVNLKWSSNILSVFDFTQDFFGAKFNFVSVQCLANSYTQDVVEQFYLNLLVQMSIPFMIFLFNSVYFTVSIFISWSKREKNSDNQKDFMIKQDLKHVSLYIIILNGVVCLHLFYPLLTSTPTQLFSCQTIAQDSFGNQKQFLGKNYHVECWTKQFTKWFYGFGILCSMFFGLGIPFLLTFYMWLYKSDFQSQDRQTSKQTVSVTARIMTKSPTLVQVSQAEQSSLDGDLRSGLHSFRSLNKSIVKEKSSPTPLRVRKSLSRHETIRILKKTAQANNISSNLRKSVKQKQLKQSEVFAFLVDPYKSTVFYWEIVTLLRKFVLIMIGLLGSVSSQDPANQSVKYLMLNVYLVIFYRLNLRYEPFYSPLFNLVENTSFLVVIITCLSGIFTSVVEGPGASVLSDIVFFSSNSIYIIFMAFIFYALIVQQDTKEFQKGNTYIMKYVQEILSLHKTRQTIPSLNSSRMDEEPMSSMR